MIRQMVQNHHFLSIRNTGQPCGTIVYIHGLGESGICFNDLVLDTKLADWNHVVPDLAGYGRSIWPKESASLDQHTELIIETVRSVEIRPIILVGHSMGGVIGQFVCERHPDLVDGFFNVEGNISLQDCTFSSRAARQTSAKFEKSGFDELRKWVYLAGLKKPAFRHYYASLMLAHPGTFHMNSRELVQVSKQEDLAFRLTQLKTPSCYVAGLNGGAGVRSLELLRKANTDRILLDGAGHWPFIDKKNEFIDRFVKFTYATAY